MAILQVIGFHYCFWTVGQSPDGWRTLFSLGWTGVDLFFVLSGFLLGGILIDHRGEAGYFRTFYLRRCFRILPLYLIAIFIIAGLGGILGPLWPFLTFTQNFAFVAGMKTSPAAAVTWSLAIEEQFYLVLPVIIWLMPPRWLPWLLIAISLAAPSVRIELTGRYGDVAYFLLPARMDGLFLGVLAAILVRQPAVVAFLQNRAAWLRWIVGAAIVGYIGLEVLTPIYLSSLGLSLLVLGYAAIVLVVAGAKPASVPWKALAVVGKGAYSSYLFHRPARDITGIIAGPFGATLLAVAAVSLIAWRSWRLVEEPLISFAHDRWRYGELRHGASKCRPYGVPQ